MECNAEAQRKDFARSNSPRDEKTTNSTPTGVLRYQTRPLFPTVLKSLNRWFEETLESLN